MLATLRGNKLPAAPRAQKALKALSPKPRPCLQHVVPSGCLCCRKQSKLYSITVFLNFLAGAETLMFQRM